MKKVKGIAAFAAAVMSLNSATIVLAAPAQSSNANYNGIGTFEGNVGSNAEVFDVVFPTLPIDEAGHNKAFNFILDPNNLIEDTEAIKYGGKSFNFADSHGLYFANSTGAFEYSGKSDEITAVNKGTDQIKVTLKAELTDADGITLYSKGSGFSWDNVEDAGMYMSINDKENTPNVVPISNNTKTAEIVQKIAGAEIGEGTITWDETNGYQYTDGEIDGVNYTFYLAGEAGGNWSALDPETTAPQINLVWNLKQVVPDVEPSVPEEVELAATGNTEVNVNLGSGDYEATGLTSLTISSTAWATFNGKNLDWLTTNNYVTYDSTTGILTFKEAFTSPLKGRGGTTSATLVFNNTASAAGDAPTTKTINFTIGS